MTNRLFLTLSLFVILMQFAVNQATAQQIDMKDKVPVIQKNIFLNMMDTMMMKMGDVKSGKSVAADFISQMIPHHEGAIEMAKYQVQYGKDFIMIQLAKSILAEQTNELQQMHIWLKKSPVKPDSTPVGFKQSMDQTMAIMIQNLPPNSSLTDTDHAFARVMIPHHQAAIDMSKVALKYTKDRQTNAFAKQLISSEQVEIELMSSFLK